MFLFRLLSGGVFLLHLNFRKYMIKINVSCPYFWHKHSINYIFFELHYQCTMIIVSGRYGGINYDRNGFEDVASGFDHD